MARVRFSRKALADLRAIHTYLAERNPAAAAKVVGAIEPSVGLIADHPGLGSAEDSGRGRLHTVPRFGCIFSHRPAWYRFFKLSLA